MATSSSSIEPPSSVDAQHKLYEMILCLAKPMALKAAVLLNIPDIIASEGHGDSLSLQQIAAHISPPPQSNTATKKAWILHDWDEEQCVRILNKCREAIPENGKIIIVDAVVERNKGSMRRLGLSFDIAMITFTSGGKERTEEEFKALFEKAGFKSYTLLNLPAVQSIIELSKD